MCVKIAVYSCSAILSSSQGKWLGWGERNRQQLPLVLNLLRTSCFQLSCTPGAVSLLNTYNPVIILGIFGFEKFLMQNETRFPLKIKIHGWEAMAVAWQWKQFSANIPNSLEENNAWTLLARCYLLFYLVLKWSVSSSNTSKNCPH